MKSFWFGLYNAIAHLVAFGIRVIAIFNPKFRNWINVRRNWRSELESKIGGYPFWIWFHASSAGEYEDGIEVVKSLRLIHPETKLLVTFFSSSGFQQHKDSRDADVVFYLPLDTRKNARDFYRIVNPAYAIFSRNDIWPNYIEEFRLHDNKPYLLSFLCNAESGFFGFPQRNLYKFTFNSFEAIGAQNLETCELLAEHFKVSNCFEAGNTRTARILARAQTEFHDEMLQTFSEGYFTITVGSALSKDIEFIMKCARDILDQHIRWIIVPHKPNELTAMNCVSRDSSKHLTWSSKYPIQPHHQFLWLDTVGILAEAYKYSQLAWVGGGFDKIGIHNISEPVARNNYVAFGPNHRNYPEAIRAINTGFGFCLSEPSSFVEVIKKIASKQIKVNPSISESDARAVEFHLNLMKREAGLE